MAAGETGACRPAALTGVRSEFLIEPPVSFIDFAAVIPYFVMVPISWRARSNRMPVSTRRGNACRITNHGARIEPRKSSPSIGALKGPLLPILHALQETFGYIDQAAEPMIAEALNISRAEVHGVFTFYHDFRSEPAGRHVLKLCRAEACQAAGGDALAARAEARLGIHIWRYDGGRTGDA